MSDEKVNWVNLSLAFLMGAMLSSMALCILIFSGGISSFITDGHCNDMVEEGFINGTYYGMNYILATITEQAIQCEEIPINYSNYTYTLIAAECLEGVANG